MSIFSMFVITLNSWHLVYFATERSESWLVTNENFEQKCINTISWGWNRASEILGTRRFGGISFKVYQNIKHKKILNPVIQWLCFYPSLVSFVKFSSLCILLASESIWDCMQMLFIISNWFGCWMRYSFSSGIILIILRPVAFCSLIPSLLENLCLFL